MTRSQVFDLHNNLREAVYQLKVIANRVNNPDFTNDFTTQFGEIEAVESKLKKLDKDLVSGSIVITEVLPEPVLSASTVAVTANSSSVPVVNDPISISEKSLPDGVGDAAATGTKTVAEVILISLRGAGVIQSDIDEFMAIAKVMGLPDTWLTPPVGDLAAASAAAS